MLCLCVWLPAEYQTETNVTTEALNSTVSAF